MHVRVRPGQVLPHNGTNLPEGTLLELPDLVAREVRHLVQPVDVLGQPIEGSVFDEEIGRARLHEQVTLFEAEIAKTEARLAALKAGLADVQATLAIPAPPRRHVHVDDPVVRVVRRRPGGTASTEA